MRPRSFGFPYFGKASDDENGCIMRPKKPRFFIVEVVFGAGVKTGLADGVGDARIVPDGAGAGEDGSNRLSCARMAAAEKTRV